MALLFVHAFASSSSSIAHQLQELVISSNPSIPRIDLSTDDIIFKPITIKTQLCKLGDSKPREGKREVGAIHAHTIFIKMRQF
jgi:hypothetical protein